MLRRFFFLLTTLAYVSCVSQGTELDREEINKVWETYYSSIISNKDKVDLVSSEFKNDYMDHVVHAIYTSEYKLRQMKFEKKLDILLKRYMIDSLELELADINLFSDAFTQIEATSSELIITDGGLHDIIFKSDKEAYGIFVIFLREKSNQFVKENDKWKINPSKEHGKYALARKLIKDKYVKQFGSEDNAIDGLLEISTGRKGIWKPLMPK